MSVCLYPYNVNPPLSFLSTNSYRVSGQPKLHREFKTAVKNLPKIYQQENKQRYYKLIDNFGTHYITKVRERDGQHQCGKSSRQ